MIGKRIGHYEVTAKLGEGGMGEVWRATDSKLGREVALKLLPEAFTEDEERLARFEREAKVLASLNHPNIAAIHGVEESGSTRALVMELVEGPTLADRMEQGPIPVEESLSIARQIAEALEEAHSKGIVHRDLKPQNIKASMEGKVKVLDFGLAKAMDPMGAASGAGSASQLAASPTLTLGATIQGVILGTAAYMSPEQAKGASVDHRADVWAFGVVLWEMLTGRRLFAGDTVPETLAGVLKSEIDIEGLPAELPSKLVRLVRRCLERQPKNRLHSIADARIVLEEIQRGDLDEAAAGAGVPAAVRPLWQTAAAVGGALALVAALAIAVARALAPAPEPPRVVRFQVPRPPELPILGPPRLSPDGRYLALDATDEAGASQIWVRPLDALGFYPLPGTEGASRPWWSPDSRHLAFMAGGKLKRVAISGGSPQTICDAPSGSDGTWGEDGTILFDGIGADPILRVSAAGGVATPLVEPREGEEVGWPQFLPGGERFFYVDLLRDGSELWMANRDGTGRRKVMNADSRVEYAAPGYLLFVRDQTLVAQKFDVDAGELVGEPTSVTDGLFSNRGAPQFSASRTGSLTYRTGGTGTAEYAWFDREGRRVGSAVESGDLASFALSPDERWLAYQLGGIGPADVWVRDLQRGVSSRFTFGESRESVPLITPDGLRVISVSTAEGRPTRVVSRALDRSGAEELLWESPDAETGLNIQSVTPDGRFLVGTLFRGGETGDLWRIPIGRPGPGEPILETPSWEWSGEVSPDGRWVAFASDESGRGEIYVVAFDGGRGRWQISTQGANEVHWSPKGDELFYTVQDGRLFRVEVRTGASFEAGAPEPLFAAPLRPGRFRNRFRVSADAQRFLALTPAGLEGSAPTTVVLNWVEGLPRL